MPSVEYAMEAISHAGTVLGVLAKDGVVLAAEKKVTGKLLDLSSAKDGGYGGSGEKIYLLNSCVLSSSSSWFSVILIEHVRLQQCYWRRRWSDGRRQLAGQLCKDSSPAAFVIV